jgi:acyl transferase domain-containing protein
MTAAPYGTSAGDGIEPIAIIGMSVRVPGAGDVKEYWRNLIEGVESVKFSTREEQQALGVPVAQLDDPAFVPAAAALDDVEYIDASYFGMTPREAELRDPQQRLFLELAHTALEDAGYDPGRYDGEIGVYGGTGGDDYQWKNIRRNPAVMASTGTFAVATSNHASYLSTFTSYKLNLRGPSLTVQTACSTSLVALHLACEALRNRECETALAGAASIDVPHGWGYVHTEGGVMSPDGHCRAFDAGSAGTLWGSGGGVVVLKRLADALADGDTIRSVVLSSAINNDGSDKVGFTAPSIAGQTAVIAQALGIGGVDPRSIGYVEAHGTGTALGDPIEVAALSAAFGAGPDEHQWCALGSVKTNIGHLSSASGIVGLVKTVLALENAQIPPSLHFETPHPKIDFTNSPFYVNAALAPWSQAGPRRAGVSSFGVGGTNAHVILQEPPTSPPDRGERPRPQLLQLTARTPAALAETTARLGRHLDDHPELDLSDVAFTLRHGRRPHPHRAWLVADDTAGAAAALLGYPPAGRSAIRSGQAPVPAPRVAFLLSGQGSQYAGMGSQLYRAEPAYRAAVDECSILLREHLGLDLRELLLAAGPDRAAADARLVRTALAQPALFTVEYALAGLWAQWGLTPDAMLGHSIGEYVAATLAGVFSLPDALRLVARRGALMQSLPAGSMLAVPLDEGQIRVELPPQLSVAAVNGPGSCVVSGPAPAIDAYLARLEEGNVPGIRLRTSHAFHSSMTDPILAAFGAEVAAVERRAPERPILSNLTGDWAGTEQLTDPAYWVCQLRQTVRFGDGVATLLADGDWTLLEVGPGGQLAAQLHRRTPADRPALTSLPGPRRSADEVDGVDETRADDLATMLSTAGQLWARGVHVHPGPARGRRIPLPTYPFERKHFWVRPTAPDEPAPTAAAAGPLPAQDWFAVPSWRQLSTVPAITAPGVKSESGPTLVIGSGPQVAELAGRLREGGADVHVVEPGDPVTALAALPGLPARIVHAATWQARPCGPDPDAAWAAQDTGFFAVLALAQALAAAQPRNPIHLDVVCSGTQAVVGGDLARPEHACLAAAALVLPLELPWLSVRLVDAEATGETAREVGAELLRPAPEDAPIVALRGKRRWIRDWEQIRLPDPTGLSPGLRPGGVCLITGGLGGIGITIAEQLAEREQARLVLLSRTPLPEHHDWDSYLAVHGSTDRLSRAISAVRRMERAGAEVLVLAGDVTDLDDLTGVRHRIMTEFGRLDLIVHAAGVAGGGMAEVKERAQAEAVLAPKLRGTLALASVFGDLAMDAVVLCGSVTGVAGGFGQVDYCGANAFLDAVAQSGTGFDCRVVSVDWGSWLEVGMAAEVAAPSAFRALQRGGLVVTPLADPLLSTAHRDPAAATAWCTGTLGPRTHWVLDEHRLAGRALLPGTGHLAAVVAAARAAFGPGADGRPDPGQAVELTDVTLIEPMVVDDDGHAELRVAFAEGADDIDFQVSSRSGGLERTHVRGTLTRPAGPGGRAAAPRHDLAAIRARCAKPSQERLGTFSNSGLFSFGPRWSSLRRVETGTDEEIARLEAADSVAAELGRWPLHPALLDEALSFAASRVSGRFVPIGYGRLLVRSALPQQFWSHLRYRDAGSADIIVADVTLLDDDGTELLSISDFVLRGVDPDAIRAGLSAPATAALPDRALMPADPVGISPVAGVDALRRLLATDAGPQLTVSPVPIGQTLSGARALTKDSIEQDLALAGPERPERTLDGDYLAPRTVLERDLCELWQDALGLDRVGVTDDFFEAGGNSLVAVQLLAGIRARTGERVPMRALFEASTVSGMAAQIDLLRAPGGDAGPAPDEPPIPALSRDLPAPSAYHQPDPSTRSSR